MEKKMRVDGDVSEAEVNADESKEDNNGTLQVDSLCPVPPHRPPLKTVVLLTELESRIFEKVLAAIADQQLKVTVRVAGGWVRDKLLGRASEDIDFAVDTMMGETFANHINEYLIKQGCDHHRIGVIQANPGQSKHLQTATFKIDGVDIDVNNLRTEVYGGDSRIPSMKFATPQEDSSRRDFTINALFYNIHTKKVEDWTGCGLRDLQQGLLQTPLPPLKTFRDDPLRVLRAARFAGRLGYAVHQDISTAAKDPATHEGLTKKVSRERFGIEINKMLSGTTAACVYSFKLLCDWGLLSVVFEMPEKIRAAVAPIAPNVNLFPCKPVPGFDPLEQKEFGEKNCESLNVFCVRSLESMARRVQTAKVDSNSNTSSSHRISLLSAFLLPMYGFEYNVKSDKFAPALVYVVRESIRLPQKDANMVSLVVAAAFHVCALSVLLAAGEVSALTSVQLHSGHLLRAVKQDYTLVLELAMVVVTVLKPQQQQEEHGELWRKATMQSVQAYQRWLEQTSQLCSANQSNGPVWQWAPALDGKEVSKLLSIKGKAVGAVLGRMWDFQILKPDFTKQDVTTFLASLPVGELDG